MHIHAHVHTPGIPPPPENLTLTPTSTLLSVQLSWQRPKSYHRLVPVNYTVTIVMMDSNEVVKVNVQYKCTL